MAAGLWGAPHGRARRGGQISSTGLTATLPLVAVMLGLTALALGASAILPRLAVSRTRDEGRRTSGGR